MSFAVVVLHRRSNLSVPLRKRRHLNNGGENRGWSRTRRTSSGTGENVRLDMYGALWDSMYPSAG